MDQKTLDRLKRFADRFHTPTCIMAVDKLPEGGYGEIRIVTGNPAYLASIDEPTDTNTPVKNENKFIPNQCYERYVPKDLNFEDFCYRCAVLGQALHTYIHLDQYDLWMEIFMLPMESEDDSVAYCTYTMEMAHEANVEKMTDISHKTASEVLSACIKLRSSKDFKHAIHDVVQDIREICDASHCCILLTDSAERSCTVLAEAFAERAYFMKPMETYLDDDFYDITLSWNDLIDQSNCIIIKSKQDMELVKQRAPAWHASLMSAQVESIVLFPLRSQGETIGYIWALNFDVNDTLHIKQALELTTFFIAAEIAGYQMIDRLKSLGSIDLLTGVNNRNAMNNAVEQFSWSSTLGVIFADLNGLKTVNDNEGHLAGDLLLKDAALVLQRIFVGNEIYRSGGDEFLVIAEDITKDEMERRIALLRSSSETEGSPSFAVGSAFTDTETDIRKLMQAADARMYEDKAEYYRRHPEKAKR